MHGGAAPADGQQHTQHPRPPAQAHTLKHGGAAPATGKASNKRHKTDVHNTPPPKPSPVQIVSSPSYEPTSPSPATPPQQRHIPLLQRTTHDSPEGRYFRRHLQRAPEPYTLLKHIPTRLQRRLEPPPVEVCEADAKFYNIPDGPIILALYAGKDDASALEAAIQQEAPWLTSHVHAIDVERDPKAHDMLDDKLYGLLYYKALRGEILGVVGGPNCRTWSILLHKPDLRGQPGRPLRGRTEDTTWGTIHKLTPAEWTKVDDDSTLLLRQMAIYEAASTAYPDAFFLLEHPADPANHSSEPTADVCSSIWNTKLMQDFATRHLMHITTWSQCQTGMDADKPTTIVHKHLPALRKLDKWMCDHPWHPPRTAKSSQELARWSWHFNTRLAKAITTRCHWLKHRTQQGEATDRPLDGTEYGAH